LPRVSRTVLVAMLFVSVAVPAVGKTTMSGPLATFRCVEMPVLGCATLTDGSGLVQRWESGINIASNTGSRWVHASDDIARLLHTVSAGSTATPVVFFASRDPAFNTNTVSLVWRERFGNLLPVGQLAPDESGDRVVDYMMRMADPRFGQPTLLITADRGEHEFRPKVTQPHAQRAAICLGFHLAARSRLPDGRSVRVYQRTAPLPADLTISAARSMLRHCPAG